MILELVLKAAIAFNDAPTNPETGISRRQQFPLPLKGMEMHRTAWRI